MSKNSRVLNNHNNKISQAYKPRNNAHLGIDIIGDNCKNNNTGLLDYIIAHSDGVVVSCRNNIKGFVNGSYGNYVKIKHNNGYFTLYAHLTYGSVKVKVGDKVTKGQIIGYMGNTGYSFGAHLHFEVRNEKDVKTDPTPYINADLPIKNSNEKYTTGNYITLEEMNIRNGSGINNSIKKVKQMSANGKKHATSTNPNSNAIYKKGTEFTAQKIIVKGNEVWAKSPSGYICIKGASGKIYCKKK